MSRLKLLPFENDEQYALRPLEAESAVFDLHFYLSQFTATGDDAWLIQNETGQIVGYATLSAVPGLPHVADFELFVRPIERRQGVGRATVQQLFSRAQGRGFAQLSTSITDEASPAAQFLPAVGFDVEHREQVLWLADLRPFITPPTLPADKEIVTLSRKTAVFHFLTLYDRAFAPHPWYQPYSADEVEASLQNERHLLFLTHREKPIGVSWLHLQETAGRIEPFAILPAWQGQGNGRLLLLASLHRLAHNHLQKVRIGAWANNIPALTLYKRVGFKPQQTTTYFAKSVET